MTCEECGAGERLWLTWREDDAVAHGLVVHCHACKRHHPHRPGMRDRELRNAGWGMLADYQWTETDRRKVERIVGRW